MTTYRKSLRPYSKEFLKQYLVDSSPALVSFVDELLKFLEEKNSLSWFDDSELSVSVVLSTSFTVGGYISSSSGGRGLVSSISGNTIQVSDITGIWKINDSVDNTLVYTAEETTITREPYVPDEQLASVYDNIVNFAKFYNVDDLPTTNSDTLNAYFKDYAETLDMRNPNINFSNEKIKTLAKYAVTMYNTKGTWKIFNFLFKILDDYTLNGVPKDVTFDAYLTGSQISDFDMTDQPPDYYFRLTLASVAGFNVENNIAGETSGAYGTIMHIDTTNKYVYVDITSGTFQVDENVDDVYPYVGAVTTITSISDYYGLTVNDSSSFLVGGYVSAQIELLYNLDIDTITWQSGNTVRYTFNGTPDLSGVEVGDYQVSSSCTNSTNDGDLLITAVNDGSDYIEVTNSSRSSSADDEATDAVGTCVVVRKGVGVVKYVGDDVLHIEKTGGTFQIAMDIDNAETYVAKETEITAVSVITREMIPNDEVVLSEMPVYGIVADTTAGANLILRDTVTKDDAGSHPFHYQILSKSDIVLTGDFAGKLSKNFNPVGFWNEIIYKMDDVEANTVVDTKLFPKIVFDLDCE